jgi:hypothetical protein
VKFPVFILLLLLKLSFLQIGCSWTSILQLLEANRCTILHGTTMVSIHWSKPSCKSFYHWTSHTKQTFVNFTSQVNSQPTNHCHYSSPTNLWCSNTSFFHSTTNSCTYSSKCLFYWKGSNTHNCTRSFFFFFFSSNKKESLITLFQQTVPNPQIPNCAPLFGTFPSNFNTFVFGDFVCNNSETRGRLGVAGNINVYNYGLGCAVVGSPSCSPIGSFTCTFLRGKRKMKRRNLNFIFSVRKQHL